MKTANFVFFFPEIRKFGVSVLEMIAIRRPMEEFERGGRVCRVGLSRKGQKNNQPEDEKKKGYMIDQAIQGIGLGLMCTDIPMG